MGIREHPPKKPILNRVNTHCRRIVVYLCIKNLDKNQALSKLSILHSVENLVASWNAMSEATIINCFQKANISSSSQKVAPNDLVPF